MDSRILGILCIHNKNYPNFVKKINLYPYVLCVHAQLCLTFCNPKEFNSLWTVAREAALSMRFSWQEYRTGLPFPSPGDLPDPGIEPTSPVCPAGQVDALLKSYRGGPLTVSPF